MLGFLFSCVFYVPYYVLSTFFSIILYIVLDWIYYTPLFAIGIYVFSRMDSDIWTTIYERFGRPVTDLKGQVIWVTGASSGIGAELAVLLAKNGSKLVLSATREGHLEQVKSQCLKSNVLVKDKDVLVLPLDITDIESHQDKLNKVIEHFGRVDILVNNAGKLQMGLFRQTELAVDRSTFEINFFGVVSLTRLVVNDWLSKDQKGHLAVTSSAAGYLPGPNSSTYSASKHAINGYFDSIRGELFNRGITVSVVCPGPVATEIFASRSSTKVGEEVAKVNVQGNYIMTSKRCAHLIAIVLANKISFAILMKQPVLFLCNIANCFPTLVRMVVPFILTEDKIRKMID